jgi:ribosomal protein L40E
MRLNNKDQEEVRKKLNELQVPRKCAACQKEMLVVSDIIFALAEYDADGLSDELELPVAAIICRNCGHVMLFCADIVKAIRG